MIKYKNIFIIFSLILSIIFINITPVYCLEDSENEDYLAGPVFGKGVNNVFDYNIFNANIIPLFINKETGEGFYYTGSVPEVTIEEDNIKEGYSDYENLLIDVVDYNIIAEADSDDDLAPTPLYIGFNNKKTHLYYYNPSNNFLELFCSGSRFFDNDNVYGSNYLVEIKDFIGVNIKNSKYSILKSYFNNNWEFVNYALTSSNTWRLYDLVFSEDSLLGVLPEWLNNSFPYVVSDYEFTILDYHQNIYINDNFEYSVTSTIKDSYYYDSSNYNIRDLYTCFYSNNNDGTFDNDSYLLFKYKINTNLATQITGDLGICFDYYNTFNKKFERVYTSYYKLCDLGFIDEDLELQDSKETYTNDILKQIILKVSDIKSLSHLGDNEDIQILGFNVYWEKTNNNDYDETIKTYTYSHSIGDSCYVSFNFDNTTQNIIPNSVKIYRLANDCNTWVRYYISSTINSEDTPISNGIPGNTSLNGLKDNLSVDNILKEVGNFPNAIKVFFLNLPPVLISLIVFSFSLFCLSALIKYIRG